MEAKKYFVNQDHTSEYSEPITIATGAPLTVGEKYEGPEGWDNWLFCDTLGQKEVGFRHKLSKLSMTKLPEQVKTKPPES